MKYDGWPVDKVCDTWVITYDCRYGTLETNRWWWAGENETTGPVGIRFTRDGTIGYRSEQEVASLQDLKTTKFSVLITPSNLVEVEKWLEMKGDTKAARQLRNMFPKTFPLAAEEYPDRYLKRNERFP